jgi:hypothetical protein
LEKELDKRGWRLLIRFAAAVASTEESKGTVTTGNFRVLGIVEQESEVAERLSVLPVGGRENLGNSFGMSFAFPLTGHDGWW